MGPKLTVCIKVQTEWVAVTQCPYLRCDTTVFDEGIVLGNRSVTIQTDNFTQIHIHILSRCEFLPFPRTNEEIIIRGDTDAMAIVTIALNFRGLRPNAVHIRQRSASWCEG